MFVALSVVLTLSGCAATDSSARSSDSAPSTSSTPERPTVSSSPTTTAPPATSSAQPPNQAAEGSDPAASDALAVLQNLPIKGRAPKTGYDRVQFGTAWTDDVSVEAGHNGCDTRNDILRRDLIDIQIKPNSGGCVVLTGTLNDPYSGKVILFVRGQDTSSAVQIDHVVALSDAWQKGAQQLSADQRKELANDPVNLQATSGAINTQKGAGDAATWLPPNKAYRCTYVARQVQVKAKYGLWVTQAEHDAIEGILVNCGAIIAAATVPPPATTSAASSAAPQVVGPAPATNTAPNTAPPNQYRASRASCRYSARSPSCRRTADQPGRLLQGLRRGKGDWRGTDLHRPTRLSRRARSRQGRHRLREVSGSSSA